MASKREKLYLAAEQLNGLACPVCGERLAQTAGDFACVRGHRINVNRKGCINVLSKQAEGCYDAALFEARQRVLRSGCYAPVADAMERLLPEGKHRLLDAGCGEGWYLNELLARHEDWCGAGVDISRDAIERATDQPCAAVWCVGDLRRLPFTDGAFTAVLDVLTPANYGEFRRVLAENGVLIKVYPGSAYLREIRQARGLPPYEEGQVDAYLREKAKVLATERVTVTQSVDALLWRDFVWMTPLNQDLSAEEKQTLAERPMETVTVDLHVTAVKL